MTLYPAIFPYPIESDHEHVERNLQRRDTSRSGAKTAAPTLNIQTVRTVSSECLGLRRRTRLWKAGRVIDGYTYV